jgi:hypothetical protein
MDSTLETLFENARESLIQLCEAMDGGGYDCEGVNAAIDDLYEAKTHLRQAAKESP